MSFSVLGSIMLVARGAIRRAIAAARVLVKQPMLFKRKPGRFGFASSSQCALSSTLNLVAHNSTPDTHNGTCH